MSLQVKRTVFKSPDLTPTLLPDCDCKTRRIIQLDDDIFCGECGVSYGKGGSKTMVLTKVEYVPVKDGW
jgi:hypothetical protein